MSAKNKKIIETVNAAFARNDIETFLAHCTEDVVWTMVGDKPLHGKDAIRKFMSTGPSEPPKFSVDSVVAESDIVIAQGDMTMNEDGGVAFYSYCDVWRFSGDKIAELRAYVIKTDKSAVRSEVST